MAPLPYIRNKADWERRDPVLPSGVAGFERDTGKVKVGTGNKKWSELSYADVAPFTVPSAVTASGSSTPVSSASSGKVRRQVSGSAGFPSGSRNPVNTGGTNTQVQQVQAFVLTEDVADLAFTFGNFFRDSTADMALEGTSSVTIRLGLWDGVQTYPIFWPNGSRDLTIEPGGTATTTPLLFKGVKGQRVWLVRRMTWATPPSSFPATTLFAGTATEVNEWGTALADRTTTYGQFYTRSAGIWAVLPPLAITATVNPGPVVAVLGDSIASDGSQEYYSDEPTMGWAQGGLADNGIPWLNLGTSGLALWHVLASRAGRAQLFATLFAAKATHLLVALATNDLAPAGQTSAQLLANLNTLRSELAPLGIKVVAVTPWPKTNASNNGGDAFVFAQRAAFNAALRSGNGIGDGFYDLAKAAENPADANLWRTDLRSAAGISVASGGSGYKQNDLLILPRGGNVVVTTVTSGAVTAVSTTSRSLGGWTTDPSGAQTPIRGISNDPASRGIFTGTGATFTYTGIASASPTADGIHPNSAMTRLARQDFAAAVPALFTV